MSTGCKSSHSGFLDVSRSNGGGGISSWIGHLSRLTIFSTSLSVSELHSSLAQVDMVSALAAVLFAVKVKVKDTTET